MARYVSVRGWLECEYEYIPEIKKIVDNYSDNYSAFEATPEVRSLYQKGWRFPQDKINWTAYIFYGADIKSQCVDYIREQIIKISLVNDEIRGLFYVDDEEGERRMRWEIYDGNIAEEERYR